MSYNKSTKAIHKAVALLRDSPEVQDALILTNGNSNLEPLPALDTCNSLGLSLDLLGNEVDSTMLHDIPAPVSLLGPGHSDENCKVKCGLNSNALDEDTLEVKIPVPECGSENIYGSSSVAPMVVTLDYDINECEFTEMELDEPAHTLSPRALYFQRLRSLDTQDDARERAAYLSANPPPPRVFDTPLHSLYVRRSAIALGLHSPLRASVFLPEMCSDATSFMMPSWSDSEEDELEDLEDLKTFFNSPPSSPSMTGRCEGVQPHSPVGSWSDEEDEGLEAVEELENFFKSRVASLSTVAPAC